MEAIVDTAQTFQSLQYSSNESIYDGLESTIRLLFITLS